MLSLFQVLMLPVQAAAERAAKCHLWATLTITLVEAQTWLQLASFMNLLSDYSIIWKIILHTEMNPLKR